MRIYFLPEAFINILIMTIARVVALEWQRPCLTLEEQAMVASSQRKEKGRGLMDSKKILSMDEYRRLKEVVETYPEERKEARGLAVLVDFSAFQQEAQDLESLCQKAKQRSLSALRVLNSLVKDYEAQMLV